MPVECRLYAEDPTKNFLPSPGKIKKLKIPNIGLTNIRLDIGVDEGDEISFYYDPMIAKIISKGVNRNESIKNMIHYLNNLEIEGINTNKDFLISVLQNKSFEEANYNTKFIENNLPLFTKKITSIPKIKNEVLKSDKIIQKYTDKDVKAFEKIVSKSPKDKNFSKLYRKRYESFQQYCIKKNKY